MAVQSHETLTLETIAARISVNEAVPKAKSTELRSAIATFARVCSRQPHEIIAEPAVVGRLASNAPWQLAPLTKASWANVLSRVTQALDLAGIAIHRRRRNFKLSDDWEALLGTIPPIARQELHRFAGWCTVRAINPKTVTTDVFDSYRDYLSTQTVLWNPRERWQVARRAWNKSLAVVEGSHFATIPNTAPPEWRGLSWSAFPQSLQDEVALYRKTMCTQALFDDDHKVLKPVTVHNYLQNIRIVATRLVEDGLPIHDLTSLAQLIEPDVLRRAMILHMGQRDKAQALPGLHAIAVAALSCAKFLKVPEDHNEALRMIFKQVRHRQVGMTPQNKQRLGQFDDDQVSHRLLSLPRIIAKEYEAIKTPTLREAQRMQNALVLEILLHMPMRVQNVSQLDLERHFSRPLAGAKGLWRISIPAHEVKNDRAIDFEFNAATTALLELFVSTFRPVLKPGPSTILIIAHKTGAKCPSVISKQFSTFLRRELGLTVNIHLMRHFAAFTYLNANPGDYETVRQVLNHKNITTTASIYAGSESKTAFALFDKIIESCRSQGGPPLKGTDNFSAQDLL